LTLLLSVSLAACGPATAPIADGALPTAEPTAIDPSPSQTVSAATSTAPLAPTGTRPVITEQYATDPATVNLAAGRPTLVKFFAFW
jgi:hypothetical protein